MTKLFKTDGRKKAFGALLGATAVAGAVAMIGVPALATPGSGFSGNPQAVGSLDEVLAKADKAGHWDVTLKTKDTSTVGVDNLTIQPSGHSGWHTHTGLTLVTITSGQVEWSDGSDCSKTVYHAGDSFVEPANHVHKVANPYGNTATITAVQIRPEGTGPRIDAPAPACAT
ncbi:cupin domain-containing protein [Novosphingobium aquiterrae]|uniref:Cupin domain-containing protein n=1 Tax=Novosphingobium aquiterrae TaxID=624388 RepID=A0ABV6PE16_9SPHN